jgi:hypothetical protein
MKMLKSIAVLTVFAVPCIAQAATDGALGATSQGNFLASIQVNAPTGTNVQILGLDDYAFAPVTGQITLTTAIPAMDQQVCLNRSNAGNLLVKIDQSEAGAFTLKNGDGDTLALSIQLAAPGAGFTGLSNNNNLTTVQSGAGCTAASGNNIAHTLRLAPTAVPAQATAKYGAFSRTFNVTLSPQ